MTVMIISETDYVFFQLAASGYLGQALYFETTRAREISFDEHFRAIESLDYWNRPMLLLTILFGMFLGWFYIIFVIKHLVYILIKNILGVLGISCSQKSTLETAFASVVH